MDKKYKSIGERIIDNGYFMRDERLAGSNDGSLDISNIIDMFSKGIELPKGIIDEDRGDLSSVQEIFQEDSPYTEDEFGSSEGFTLSPLTMIRRYLAEKELKRKKKGLANGGMTNMLGTGGITGNKNYNQYESMNEESMGYMNGGGIGTMMQPRQNFARGGGADYIGLNPNDTSIQIEDLTETDNNGNFLISAADALPDQTGTINSSPSITNRDLKTIEGSLIDGDDPSSRYAVQKDFDSLPPSYNDPRIVSEELGITGYGKPNIRDVAGESTMPFNRDYSLFDLARMGNPNEITDRNRGMNNIGSPTEIDTFSQNFDKNYDASSDALVPGMGKKEINFIDAPADGILTKNNIAKGFIDKNITNRAFNAGTPEATAQFLAANGFPIPENLKQFLEVDTTTGKYVSKKSPNNFMNFISNIPTPFNLAKKGLEAISNPERRANLTGYSTQADYDRAKQGRIDNDRIKTIEKTLAKQAKKGNVSQVLTDRRQDLIDKIESSRKVGTGNTYTGFGKSGMGRNTDYMGQGGGGGSSSGGKSIVCTAMYQTTGLQDWAKAMKVWYIYQKRHLSDAHQEGYHLLFKPFVKGMHKSKIIRAIGAHVAKHRTQELKHIMFNSKSDTLGKIYNNILEPICYLAGKIKSIFKK